MAMIDLFNPGLEHYIERIERGPFTLVRYGDGEWRVVANLPLKPEQRARFTNPAAPGAREVLRNTVVNCHRDSCYLMASCYPKVFKAEGCSNVFESWLKYNMPKWVTWHHGHVWRNAALAGQLFPLFQAVREQPLPVVLIGPEAIADIGEALGATKHIVISEAEAWYDRPRMEHRIIRFGKPAFYCFSAGAVGKVMIHDLWSQLGRHSFMIDFGAVWAGLCGQRIRAYHKRLTPELIQRNLTGK